ncbi:MAG: class I SAM-dependent methyltransferase [Bacteroidota bacterium]|nr:class I SAM-dependent methyltransferase [Bacteroidota bacterium]MDP4251899.1 class I SAM-dependent methyltransferase [Bacteroidota bacterium]
MISQDKALMFRNRLSKVFRHVSKLARRQSVSCYRIYDHDLPEFPFCIEIYGDWLYVAEYRRNHHMDEDTHDQWMAECREIIHDITAVPAGKMVVRTRQRKAGRLDQYQKLDDEQQFITVEEQGLKFKINLTDYLDTGLFLDHRVTRNLVRQGAAGKKVLNLFCYTGSFSVYAAAGGASEVVSVDLSRTYLKWATENMELNGLYRASQHTYLHEDVKQYLETVPEAHFDLVIMDPPTFSNSKRMVDFLDVQRDHPQMINQALKGMKAGGSLYFSTNFSRFQMNASEIPNATIKDITRSTTPFDFQNKLSRFCFLITKPDH